MKDVPSSVYRLQLSENFPLRKAIVLLPYLKKLGVDGIYCSPYFAAYSPHGYDIIDPNRINPKVASSKEFGAFCRAIKKYQFIHIVDIVPNHMGIKGDNPWWQDVLKKGKKSKYASFFDIDWSKEKILIPILGEPYEQALKKCKLVRKKNQLFLQYADQFFPINEEKTHSRNLHTLLEKQNYRLVHSLSSAQETSYRRFFNINELIGICIENPKVLKEHHKWIFELLQKKKVDGLRVDHPDGLYDPKKYFQTLRKKHSGLIVVEKILGWEEEIPEDWSVNGTVGYEFLNLLTGIFVKQTPKLTQVYEHFIGEKIDFEQMLYEKKKFYMAKEMAGDIRTLAEKFYNVSSKLPNFINLPKGEIIQGLYEFLACFPVYRSYIAPKGIVPARDKPYVIKALEKARHKNRELGDRVFDFFASVFSLKIDTPKSRDSILRFQQLSAPIMAKGFEDITLYNYNRLLALNEVGSSPDRLGVTIEEFHHFCTRKQKKWPLGFLASSTHDTKRSHDVRMQLAVLSEIPEKWEKVLTHWSEFNHKYKTKINDQLFPEPNTEYFLYQILLGAWPSRPSFERMWQSFQKSIREARAHTSWRHPNPQYEKACHKFLKALFSKKNPFFASFEKFHKEITEYGQWNSLSSTALKLGCPGIVDIYQGCENWRYLLVDPDNRTLVNCPQSETLKIQLHQIALPYRKKHKALFLEGEYIPLKTKGPKKDHIIAYLRIYRQQACLVAGVRFFASLKDLSQTEILIPPQIAAKRGVELFSNQTLEKGPLKAEQLFQNAPFAWICY